MRSLRFLLFVPIVTALALVPGAAAPVGPQGDAASGNAERVAVAIADFGGRDPEIARAISETVTTDLQKGSRSLQLVERAALQKILDELKIENSGLMDPKTAQQIGQLAGAKKMITGSYTRAGNRVALHARLVDVATGQLETGQATQVEGTGGDDADIYGMAHTLSDQIHYAITRQWLPAEPPSDPLTALSPIGLEANLDRKPGSTYYWNETMRISFRAKRPCYVYVYNIDTSKAISQLYPNEYCEKQGAQGRANALPPEGEKIQADRWYQLPPEDEKRWELGIEGETGPEEIVLLASEEPIPASAGKAKLGDLVAHNATQWRGRQVVPRLKAGSVQEIRIRFYTTKEKPGR